MTSKAKVYEEVLHEIQAFIRENQLSPGDRLPSERELSDLLNAGRSSVREALRAIELLGLIETRRGEGTFLNTYHSYHLVELLASFILHEPKSKQDILSAKRIIEKEAAKLAYTQFNQDIELELETIISTYDDQDQKHYSFFIILFRSGDNYLLQKIWELMDVFSRTIEGNSLGIEFYFELLSIYKNRNFDAIERLFDRFNKH